MNGNGSNTARALRQCGVVWLVAWSVTVGLSWVHKQLLVAALERGDSVADVGRDVETLGLISTGVYIGAAIAVLIFSLSWARRPERRAWLARAGWLAFALHLAALAVIRASMMQITESADVEVVRVLQLVQYASMLGGMTLLLAGTRGSTWGSLAFAVAASGWFALLAWQPHQIAGAVWQWVWIGGGGALQVGWLVALWRAAVHYPAEGADAATAEVAGERRTAAEGLRLLRAGLTGRICIGVGGVSILATAGSSSGVGALAWLVAFASVAATIVIGVGITRYGSLPDAAQERGLVSTVIACLAVGVVLDLYAAHSTARLLDLGAQASGAGSFWEMPSMSELESLQAQMQWSGRLASMLGIAGAISLAVSLRKTARWLDEESLASLADRLWIVTLIGGGAVLGGLTLARSGDIRDVGLLVVVGLAALGAGIWLLAAWYRLLGGVIRSLSTIRALPLELDESHWKPERGGS